MFCTCQIICVKIFEKYIWQIFCTYCLFMCKQNFDVRYLCGPYAHFVYIHAVCENFWQDFLHNYAGNCIIMQNYLPKKYVPAYFDS